MRNEILREAVLRFGPRNEAGSTEDEWRFGRRGSKRVDAQTGYFIDFETGESGYLLDRWRRVAHQPGPVEREAAHHRRLSDWRESRARKAIAIFKAARPIAGTLGEKYLRAARRIDLAEWPPAIRYHPRCARADGCAPAVVAEMRGIRTDAPTAIQRIFIYPDATGRDGDRMMFGAARGAVCKLSPDEEVGEALGLAEGVETGLAVMAAGWRPAWSVMSAGALAEFPVLAGIRALTIFADHDEAGLLAARRCARRWEIVGRDVRIIFPNQPGADWNDQF